MALVKLTKAIATPPIKGAVVVTWVFAASNGWAECVNTVKASRFVVQAGGSALHDTYTGLYWQRCLVGYVWSDGEQECIVSADAGGVELAFTWQDALAAASDAEWRLPNVKELESIVDRSCFEPALQSSIFPSSGDVIKGAHWTSSQIEGYAGGAWTVNFKTGSVIPSDKSELLPVRLVRDSAL